MYVMGRLEDWIRNVVKKIVQHQIRKNNPQNIFMHDQQLNHRYGHSKTKNLFCQTPLFANTPNKLLKRISIMIIQGIIIVRK